MSRFLKISLTLIALVLALLLLAIVRVATLDPNDYKDRIAAIFAEQTGRTLTLGGEIGLNLYPWLEVSLEQVSVGNAAGFGELPMFQADSARIRIKTFPMLRSRFEIDSAQLVGARLALTVNEDGVANWENPAGDAGEQTSGASETAGIPLANFIVGGVDVGDLSIRYEDLRVDTFYEISDLDFTIEELIYGTPINLAMTLNAATNQPELAARVKLSGIVNYDLDNGRYQLAPLNLEAEMTGDTLPQGGAGFSLSTAVEVNQEEDSLTVRELSVTGLDTSLQADIRGREISSARPVYEGEINLNGSDLSQLFSAAGVVDLAGRVAELDNRSFELSSTATFDLDSDSIAISGLSVSLLGANLEGNLQINEARSEQPNISGTLNASGPDLPLVIEVVGQLSGGSDSQLSVAGRELQQVAERPFNIEVQIDTDLENGTVSIPTLDASILGASIQGELMAGGVQSDTPRLSGNLTAQGPDLPLLIQIGAWFQGGNESALFQTAGRLREAGNGEFLVTVEFDADLQEGDITVPVLSADALGVQVQGSLDASAMSGRNGSVSGSLQLEAMDPGVLLQALQQQGFAEVLEQASLNLEMSGNRADLRIEPLQADLVLAGPEIPNSPVTVTLNAAIRVDLDRESLVLDSFTVNGLGLDANGSASVDSLFESPTFQGQLELAGFDLRNLLEQLNQIVPETSDSAVLRQVGYSSSFNGSLDSISLDQINLRLDDSILTGNVALADVDRPTAEFDLNVDQINLDRYLPPDSSTSEVATEPSTGSEIPVELLRELEINGALRVGELTVADMNLSDLQLAVVADAGQLSLEPFSTNLYEGSLGASVELSVADELPQARLEVDLRQVDLEPLLFDLMDASYVSGRGNIQLAVTASGSNTTAMQSSLDGNGSIQLEDGVLRGVDVASVLQQLETMIRSRRPGELRRGNQTAFDTFNGNLTINDGVIETDDLLIRSPGFQVTGRGTLLDLSTQAIAFDLATTVDSATATNNDQEYDIGGYTLPIACSGTLATPRCLPDAGEILRARLQQEVQGRVIDLLDRAIGIEPQDTQTPEIDPQQVDPAEEVESEPELEEPDMRDELINRALDRIFN